MSSAGNLAIGILVLIWLLVRQRQMRRIRDDLSLAMPLAVAAVGVLVLAQAAQKDPITASTGAAIAAGMAIGAGLAVVRAYTVRLWSGPQGALRRGTYLTLWLWLLALAIHLGLDGLLDGRGHAAAAAGGASLLLYLGVSLAVQRVVVHRRATALGLLDPSPGASSA